MFDVYHEVDNFDSERMVDSMINIVERIKSQKTWNIPPPSACSGLRLGFPIGIPLRATVLELRAIERNC